MNPLPPALHPPSEPQPRGQRLRWPSVLVWPAWLRALVVIPVVGLLWLAVDWANVPVLP